LIQRFDPHTTLLLSHLLVFQFAYPAHRANVPDWVLDELWQRARRSDAHSERLCRGTLISREQYLVDVEQWGYLDAREMPHGRMTRQQIQDWTAAITKDKE
jgi:hypothetical protein